MEQDAPSPTAAFFVFLATAAGAEVVATNFHRRAVVLDDEVEEVGRLLLKREVHIPAAEGLVDVAYAAFERVAFSAPKRSLSTPNRMDRMTDMRSSQEST